MKSNLSDLERFGDICDLPSSARVLLCIPDKTKARDYQGDGCPQWKPADR